jgi:tetratricopeptide (TPR) repeat protein
MRSAGPTTVGLCAGLVAYAAQQLLLFPLAELDPVWWLLAGMLIAIVAPGTRADRPRSRPVAIAALALAPVALVAGVLDVAADRQADRAVSATDIDAAVLAAERAVDLRPDDLRYRSVAIAVHRERGSLADIDTALAHARSALDWSPHDPIALDAHASLLLDRAAITGADADLAASLAAWQQLADADPVRARWQVQLGRAAALSGHVELARAAWTAAADLRPDDREIAQLLTRLDASATASSDTGDI